MARTIQKDAIMQNKLTDRPNAENLSTSRTPGGDPVIASSILAVDSPDIRRGDKIAGVLDPAAIAPPARTSRRGFLMNTIVSAASLATAAAVAAPSIATASPAIAFSRADPTRLAPTVDPIFAVIEVHRKACATHTRCVGLEFALPCDDPARPSANASTSEACDVMFDLALELLEIRPTSLAGASALLNYVGDGEDLSTAADDWRFPDADDNGTPFHIAMMKHVADALGSTPAGDLAASEGEPAAHPDAALIELGAEYERLLAIEQPFRAESDRLWVVACRAHMEKMGIDPEDDNARCTALNRRYDEWVKTGDITRKEVGYDKARGKARRASSKTVRIGRKILKIKPATTAGLLVRLSVIATHDEICKTEPLEALQAEIKDFGKGVGVAAKRDGRRSVATA
jgi:hypothetical protein